VGNLIGQVKGVRSEKDSSFVQIQEFKKERDNYNAKVKELIVGVKKLNEEKKIALKKYNIKTDPEKIKEKIEKLDQSIETEAFSFEKEKKVMEQIKKLKRLYDESAIVREILEKTNKISAEIEDAKKKGREFHEKVQSSAQKGKEGYLEFIDISKRINQFKDLQEKAFKKFLDFKNEFVKINDMLKEKLSEVNKLRGFFDMRRREQKKKKEEQEKKIVEGKIKKVEEKLKKGEKLTTEDLLAYQKKEGEK